MTQPIPNYGYLVNDSGEKIAELVPVPLEHLAKVEDFMLSLGCDFINYRREMRPKE